MRPIIRIFAFALCALPCLAQAQPNRFEPNQTRRTSGRIDPGDYKGLFCDLEDWYFVDVPADQRLELSVRFDATMGDLDLEIVDARGRALGWSRSTDAAEEVLSFTPPDDMPVFIRVHNAQNTYDLHVGLADGGLNPNGATPDINCWGSDWYPFELQAGEAVRLEITFEHELGDLDMKLYDTDGNQLTASASQDDRETVTYVAEDARRVLLDVFHVHRSRNVYTLRTGLGAAAPEDMNTVFHTERLPGPGNDILELRNGDVLTGAVLNQTITIATPYADVELPLDRIAGIELSDPRDPTETIITVENNRLTGFLRTTRFLVRTPEFDEPIEIPRDYLDTVVFGMRGNERRDIPRHQYLIFANGDHFSGQILNADWTLDLGFASTPLDLVDVLELRLEDERNVTIERLDGSIVHGRAAIDMLQISMDIAPDHTFEVHGRRLSVIYPQDGFIPENVRPYGRSLAFTFPDGIEPWVAFANNGASQWMHVPDGGPEGDGCVRACGPNGTNYGNSANVTLTSPPMNVARLEQPAVTFNLRTRLEQGCDHFVLQASYDGGTSFQEIHRVTGNMEWTPQSIPLTPGNEEVVIRVCLTTDGSVVNEGIWVDTVEVVDAADR